MRPSTMKKLILGFWVAHLCGLSFAATSPGQEQFVPLFVYRTGPYAPSGIPFANGFVDYFKLINRRDGGINKVKVIVEECETGYSTERSLECYEQLKSKGPTGAAAIAPASTPVAVALTALAPKDKIPIITPGYGKS